jgi:hypothetical protein
MKRPLVSTPPLTRVTSCEGRAIDLLEVPVVRARLEALRAEAEERAKDIMSDISGYVIGDVEAVLAGADRLREAYARYKALDDLLRRLG